MADSKGKALVGLLVGSGKGSKAEEEAPPEEELEAGPELDVEGQLGGLGDAVYSALEAKDPEGFKSALRDYVGSMLESMMGE